MMAMSKCGIGNRPSDDANITVVEVLHIVHDSPPFISSHAVRSVLALIGWLSSFC